MKRILTFVLAVACSTAALAQDGDRTPYLTKSLAGDGITSVVVNTSAGGIFVTGESGEQPRIEVYVRDNHGHQLSHDEAQQRIEKNYDLDIAVNGHELSASVKNKHENMDWNNDGISISFKIYVPKDVSTRLHTSGGGIELSDLTGDEDFTTSGGGLHLSNLHGKIHGHTSGGGIEINNSSDNIDLGTSGGGISARDCAGTIKLVTSGGGIELTNLKGNIDAHTSGGGIMGRNIEGELITSTSGGGIDLKEMNCSLEAHTSAGSLNAQMAHVGKYLRLSSSAGNVNVELPGNQGYDLNLTAERISERINGNFNGTWDKEHVNGSLNGGGIPVDIHSNNNMNLKLN
jgi:hypothetical protein